MVRSGRHAAADHSFGRSAGGAALRGAGLLAIAVILGIVLLNSSDGGDFDTVSAGGKTKDTKVTTTLAPATTTTTVALRPPAEVKVLAANGTTTKGLAGKFKDKLSAAGYNALAPTDATTKPVTKSVVYFAQGYQGEAGAVATAVGLPATAVAPMPAKLPVLNLQSANILVVVGNDAPGAASAATTSTSLKRSTAATTSTTATR